MSTGYIKLWRKSLESGWLQNHKLWVFWSYCLLKATYKPCSIIVGCQQVQLEPGQFVFGRKKAAQETKLSEREVRTCIDFLSKAKNLTIKATNKFSIITLINWDFYQSEQYEETNRATNDRPTTDHKQEYKEVKEGKNKKMKSEKLSDKGSLSCFLSEKSLSFSPSINALVLDFINRVRMANDTKAIAAARAARIADALAAIAGKFGPDNMTAGIQAAFKNMGFIYSVHDPAAYVRKVAKGEHSKRIQQQAQAAHRAEKEALRAAPTGGLFSEIEQAINS